MDAILSGVIGKTCRPSLHLSVRGYQFGGIAGSVGRSQIPFLHNDGILALSLANQPNSIAELTGSDRKTKGWSPIFPNTGFREFSALKMLIIRIDAHW
jgi:hypothetical protein